ncbi:MAG: hypothetical protein MUF61_01160 [archaeon]|jgi:hypothetical protein|nr:hypothetical protein [archaeon]
MGYTRRELESIRDLPDQEVERQLGYIEQEFPDIYRESKRMETCAIESKLGALYCIVVGHPWNRPVPKTAESRKIHLACAKHLMGEIDLTGSS